MHMQGIFYRALRDKIALSLSNKYFCPRTKSVRRNRRPRARNQVFAFLCLLISIKSRFWRFVSTDWYKIVFFAWHGSEFLWTILDFKFLSVFDVQNYEKHLWKAYILKNALHIYTVTVFYRALFL